jgi:hypothetical protein
MYCFHRLVLIFVLNNVQQLIFINEIKPMRWNILHKIIYLGILILTASFLIWIFLVPSWQHNGINGKHRAKFLDMIEGNAYKPYVYRMLLPTTIRIGSLIVPEDWSEAYTNLVEGRELLIHAFAILHWETRAAFLYLLASLFMLLCFVGFGHVVVLMLEQIYGLPRTISVRILISTVALLGLLPFFRYSSYIYDPPQLFLFTLALYYLSLFRIKSFFMVFTACCLNKETALLLIPVFGFTVSRSYASRRQFCYRLLGLLFIYLAIKTGLTLYFLKNPGSFVEYQFKRNVDWIISGWSFINLAFFFILAVLVFFRWREKPFFLKTAFLCVFPPLVLLALFSGYVDEFRIYYEAYPLIFGLSLYSISCFKALLSGRGVFIQQPTERRLR